MSKLVFALLFSLLSSLTFAGELHLVKATNDEDNEICDLYLVLDEQNDISKIRIHKTVEGETTGDKSYDLDSEDGLVISELKGRDIVRMYSSNFSNHNGGDLTLKYLFNWITNNYHYAQLELVRDGDDWSLVKDGNEVSHLHFESNRKFMAGAVGVKAIRVVN